MFNSLVFGWGEREEMEVYHCAIRICHDEWVLHKPFPLNYTLRVDGSRLAMYLSVHGGALLVQERKKERKSEREGEIRLRNKNHRCTSNTAEW